METLLEKLRAYCRFLELEDSLSCWESRQSEQLIHLATLQENLEKKQQELENMKSPTFFRKVLGQASGKREKLRRQTQEITAAITAAQWELSSLEKKIAVGKQERENLRDSREIYEREKQKMDLNAAQESQLMMAEISGFVPSARKNTERALETLEDIRFWRHRGIEDSDRLKEAASSAVRLREILSVLPEGIASSGSYLQMPEEYLQGKYPLENAIEQLTTIQTQLRLLMGE